MSWAIVARMVARRLATSLILLVVVSALSFVLVALTPGDAARVLAGSHASPQQYEHVRHELRLDESLPEQYGHWLAGAVHGEFGRSLFTSEPVAESIESRLPVTLSLILGALLVSVVLGVAIGTYSAVRGGVTARLADVLGLAGFALPEFWVGAILISLFAVDLGWLPATGYVSWADSPSGWLSSLILPVAALSLGGVAEIAKHTRESMLEALSSEHVRISWASGISPASITFRHAFRSAALRVVTVAGWLFIGLLGGSVLVESVFAMPGLGSLAVTAAGQHDLPVIQGVVVCFTALVVIVNLLVDVLYMWLDPRVRLK